MADITEKKVRESKPGDRPASPNQLWALNKHGALPEALRREKDSGGFDNGVSAYTAHTMLDAIKQSDQ